MQYWDKDQTWKDNQGNQGYRGNQKNATQGQKPDMVYRHEMINKLFLNLK